MVDGLLQTERLDLRPPVAEDIGFVLERMNTPAIIRFLGGEALSEAKVRENHASDIAAFAKGEWRRWMIVLRATGERVGRCALLKLRSEAAPAQAQGKPEIGWTLAEPYWGKGYASEAARVVLRFAFDTLGLPEVFAQTSDSNQPSTRLIKRLGFAARPELGFDDPDYPPRDNPTTVWSLERAKWHEHV